MKSGAAICTFCLALATSVSAMPHGNRGRKEAAVQLLAWAEKTGGAILSEIILGKREVNGRTTYDPSVVRDYRDFLQALSSKLAALQSQTQTDTRGRRMSGQDDPSTSEVILPPDTRLTSLDYDDILDILGDYTKGFTAMLEPVMLAEPVVFAVFSGGVAAPLLPFFK